MPYTTDSKMGDILDQKPAALDVLAKHAGGGATGAAMLQSNIGMVRGMSIAQIAEFTRWNAEAVDALLADLNAL